MMTKDDDESPDELETTYNELLPRNATMFDEVHVGDNGNNVLSTFAGSPLLSLYAFPDGTSMFRFRAS